MLFACGRVYYFVASLWSRFTMTYIFEINQRMYSPISTLVNIFIKFTTPILLSQRIHHREITHLRSPISIWFYSFAPWASSIANHVLVNMNAIVILSEMDQYLTIIWNVSSYTQFLNVVRIVEFYEGWIDSAFSTLLFNLFSIYTKICSDM